MVRHVVNVGSGGKQFGPVIEVNTNHKRIRLSRAMGRHARQEFSANLERRRAVCRARFDTRQRHPDLPDSVEMDSAGWHGRVQFIRGKLLPERLCSLAYTIYFMLSRLGKTLLTATLALYFLIVAFNNLIDHETNFKFVEHVLSMDSIPADANVMWRAIRSPQVHHLAYWTIILWELTTGCICGLGAKRLFFALRSKEGFEVAKTMPIAGLWLGLLLWALVFITIGGEWFLMWESSQWNGELAALRMFVLNAITLLFLYLPETNATESSARSR